MTKTLSIRWTASRKRELVASIFSGERTTESVLTQHPDLTVEELKGWMDAYERGKGNVDHMRQMAMIDARKPARG